MVARAKVRRVHGNEVEVTPAMVRAGELALHLNVLSWYDADESDRHRAIADMFKAMLAERDVTEALGNGVEPAAIESAMLPNVTRETIR